MDGEKLIELAGRRCYKSFDVGLNPNISKIRKDSETYHKNLLESAHGSVLEHLQMTFAIEGVSRVFTHELVRHRAGCAYSQESLRYVRLNELSFWLPPEIEANPEAVELFEETVGMLEDAQTKLADLFKIAEMESFADKKKLTSAFRRIAPIGLATGILFSCNMRTLRWVIQMRTSSAAEVEIRQVFNEIFEMASQKWPFLFQDFEKVSTGDGLYECKPRCSKV